MPLKKWVRFVLDIWCGAHKTVIIEGRFLLYLEQKSLSCWGIFSVQIIVITKQKRVDVSTYSYAETHSYLKLRSPVVEEFFAVFIAKRFERIIRLSSKSIVELCASAVDTKTALDFEHWEEEGTNSFLRRSTTGRHASS